MNIVVKRISKSLSLLVIVRWTIWWQADTFTGALSASNVPRHRPRLSRRSLTRSGNRLFVQFIMFRLSSHLAREIEWRFSFADTRRTPIPVIIVAASPFSRLLSYRSTGIVPWIIIFAATTRSLSSRFRISVTLVSELFFFFFSKYYAMCNSYKWWT